MPVKHIKKFIFNKNNPKHGFDLVRVGLVLLVIALALAMTMKTNNDNNKQPENAAAPIYNVGQTATVPGSYQITVSKVTKNVELAQKMHLDEDKKILVLDVNIKNIGDKVLYFVPLLNTYVKDNEQGYYVLTPDISQPALLPKDMEKNQNNSGKLTFIVPNRDIPYRFYLDAHWDNRNSVAFDVGSNGSEK